MTENSAVLRRYTSLTYAIDMLVNQRLALLNPSSWQDKNDIAFLEAYKTGKKIPQLFAVCFTQAKETYHHWSVFARGDEGVRINIHKQKLLDSLRNDHRYAWGTVEYKTLKHVSQNNDFKLADLPFLKRYAFIDEAEFRLIYESDNPADQIHYVPLQRDWIESVTLSPWLPVTLTDTLKMALKSMTGCSNVRVQRTNLRDNAQWKELIPRAIRNSIATSAPHRTD